MEGTGGGGGGGGQGGGDSMRDAEMSQCSPAQANMPAMRTLELHCLLKTCRETERGVCGCGCVRACGRACVCVCVCGCVWVWVYWDNKVCLLMLCLLMSVVVA